MQSGRGDGVSVIIKTQAYVDKNVPKSNIFRIWINNMREIL